MMALYDFTMTFIRSMLGFAQSVYDFACNGFRLASSTLTNIINRFEAFMPGPNVLNLVNNIFTAFGTVLFAVLIVRIVMTIVNLINPLS